MICHNCNYILSGKENFCPNCGIMPISMTKRQDKTKDNTIKKDEGKTSEAEPAIIYPSFETSSSDRESIQIFQDANETQESDTKEKDRKAAGKIFLLLFLTCAFSAAAFGLADYFGITPSVISFVQTISNKSTGSTTPEENYSHNDSIVDPEINYSMSDAYIMSGNGLTLRKGPGNGYAPIDSLTDLTKVHIFGGSIANKNWVYVYCPESKSYGWLDGSFLATQETASTSLYAENFYFEAFL